MVTIGGVLRAMSTPVATGTMSSHGVMLKRPSRAAMNEAISCVSVVSIVSHGEDYQSEGYRGHGGEQHVAYMTE